MFNPNYIQTQNYTLLGVDHDILSYSYTGLIFLSIYISSILGIGVSISFLIVGNYMKGKFFIVKNRYIDRIKRVHLRGDVVADDYEQEEQEQEQEEEEQEEDKKYYKELNQMSYINKALLDANGLHNLRYKTVCEKSPDGEDIIMTYNSDSETFWYYCDNKDSVKFNTLDAVARKFAIENNCKCVCINYKEELDKAFHMVDYSVVLKQLKKNNWIKKNKNSSSAPSASGPLKSVYAAFKTYNNGANNNNNNNNNNDNDNDTDTSPGTMKKHITNRFSYKGKLNEYKPFFEKKSNVAGYEPISFANFKKIQKQYE